MNRRVVRLSSIHALLAVGLSMCPISGALACSTDLNGVQYGYDCRAAPAPRTAPAPRYYSPPPSPPPPTPEQIAAHEAYALNEQGVAAYKAGDLAGAESLFEQSLQKTPNDPVTLRNLATAQGKLGLVAYREGDYTTALSYFQKGLANDPASDASHGNFISSVADAQARIAEAQQKQEQQRQDANAAASMQQSVQGLAQTMTAAPAPSSGMDFMASSSDLKDAPNDDTPSDKKTIRGAFGDRVAKPKLKTEHHQASGSSKAGDQAKSAAATAGGGGDLTHNFDIGDAASAEPLSKPSEYMHDQSMNPATFTDREKNAPGMSDAVKRLGDLQAERSKTETDLKKVTAERNAQKDPAVFAKLDTKVKQETAAYGESLKAVHDEEATVKQIKMKVDDAGGDSPAQPAAKH